MCTYECVIMHACAYIYIYIYVCVCVNISISIDNYKVPKENIQIRRSERFLSSYTTVKTCI